jgi:ubiquinone/menaquinone biosynthesis C-methylase UbiE
MPKKKVTKKEKEEILKRVQREFPSCKALQNIHYYRYLKEIEEQTMTYDEIIQETKKGAQEVKKEMTRLY